MNFYTVNYPKDLPDGNVNFPCAVLVPDGWNDFSMHTLFKVHIYSRKKEKVFTGDLKILQINTEDPQNGQAFTHLPDEFDDLGIEYCTLGQNVSYYERLRKLPLNLFKPFLEGIKDVVFNPKIAARFKYVGGFSSSLLRFSDAEKAFYECGALFQKFVQERIFKFTFTCRVAHAAGNHKVEFDFSSHATELNRTTVIIGRNGTGKTQFLGEFALAMSGLSKDKQTSFTPRRPSFSQVIAVSYSIFDEFKRPKEQTYSYHYCGIRRPDNNTDESEQLSKSNLNSDKFDSAPVFFTPKELEHKLNSALIEITERDRVEQWKEILGILLEGVFDDEEQVQIVSSKLSFYHRLSSGQRILVNIITDIIANIEKESVILFDEPELHLHPDIFSALIRAFDKILKTFDSYAIIATHAPLLLQETLSRQVKIFGRTGNIPTISPLTIECFGENLTTITREVFAMQGTANNFRAHLTELSVGRTPEEVEALFPRGLPMQAEAFLQTSIKLSER
ncbi:AAA family ATPase [Hymenobacter algoricola]|uniref:AAA family ATPase n=1 Tax=Hymenobacter algoricola TaxID=486267 RepID=A0ABP7NDH2_9BACT